MFEILHCEPQDINLHHQSIPEFNIPVNQTLTVNTLKSHMQIRPQSLQIRSFGVCLKAFIEDLKISIFITRDMPDSSQRHKKSTSSTTSREIHQEIKPNSKTPNRTLKAVVQIYALETFRSRMHSKSYVVHHKDENVYRKLLLRWPAARAQMRTPGLARSRHRSGKQNWLEREGNIDIGLGFWVLGGNIYSSAETRDKAWMDDSRMGNERMNVEDCYRKPCTKYDI